MQPLASQPLTATPGARARNILRRGPGIRLLWSLALALTLGLVSAIGASAASTWTVVEAPDNKLVTGGYFTSPSRYLSRYQANGLQDVEFNSNVGNTLNSHVTNMVVQSDGKVVVTGAFTTPRANIARFNADGTVDTAFNNNLPTTLNGAAELLLQSDGKLLVGAREHEALGSAGWLFRFNSDGTEDEPFNDAVGVSGLNEGPNGLAQQPDGKIVVGGNFTLPSNRVARFNLDGSADTAFNSNVGTVNNFVEVALQSTGKVVGGGYFTFPSQRVARWNADGSPDTTFNSTVGTSFNDYPWSVAVQSDDKILLGGRFTEPGDYLTRLNSDGSPDTTFNTNAAGVLNAQVMDVIQQTDGKIVAGGYFTTPRASFVRFNANGEPDTLFNTNSLIQLPGAPSLSAPTSADGAAQLTWAAGSNGGSDITDYEYRLDGSGGWTSLGTAVTSGSISGLTNGQTYSVEVRAVNILGGGPASNSVNVTPAVVDTDSDGVTDAQEAINGTDPAKADTDDDGKNDGAEGTTDSDNDGTIDALESSVTDTDNDGVPDEQDSNNTSGDNDTDGDGVSNADEVAAGTDPMDSASIPVTEPPMPVTTLPTFALLLLSLLLGLFGYRRLAH